MKWKKKNGFLPLKMVTVWAAKGRGKMNHHEIKEIRGSQTHQRWSLEVKILGVLSSRRELEMILSEDEVEMKKTWEWERRARFKGGKSEKYEIKWIGKDSLLDKLFSLILLILCHDNFVLYETFCSVKFFLVKLFRQVGFGLHKC